MLRLWRILLGAFAVGLIVPATAMATVSTIGTPSITGTAKVGGTLTCNGPTWTSDDVGTPTPVDYTWYYTSDETSPIFESGDGTNNHYPVVAADVGKQIVCTQTEADGPPGDSTDSTSGVSSPTAAVQAGPPPTNTKAPSIQGGAQVGNDLFCQEEPGPCPVPAMVRAMSSTGITRATSQHRSHRTRSTTPSIPRTSASSWCARTRRPTTRLAEAPPPTAPPCW